MCTNDGCNSSNAAYNGISTSYGQAVPASAALLTNNISSLGFLLTLVTAGTSSSKTIATWWTSRTSSSNPLSTTTRQISQLGPAATLTTTAQTRNNNDKPKNPCSTGFVTTILDNYMSNEALLPKNHGQQTFGKRVLYDAQSSS